VEGGLFEKNKGTSRRGKREQEKEMEGFDKSTLYMCIKMS
jgi:hypothetical protein